MSFKTKLNRIFPRLRELWEYKVFKWAVIIHMGYFIVSLVCVLTVLRDQNDFLIYFNAGGIFYNDINDLYNQEHYIWDYRYLPLSAAFFIPFYLLGFDLGFIIFHTLNLILNILICVLLFKIIKLVRKEDHEQDEKRIILYISLYLAAAPQMFNYILGQINLYITFFMLVALYIFLTREQLRWHLFGSMILGISIVLKPTALLLIPFLMVINYDSSRKKLMFDFSKSLIRIIGVIFPISLNIIIFLLYPKLWDGFIETNFTGGNPLTLNFSFSITKIILNFCYMYNIPFNQIYVLLVVLGIIGSLGYVIFLFGRYHKKDSIIYGFTFGMVITLLVYYDSWDHHLLNLIPLLIILIFILPRKSEITVKYIKKGLLFFSFFDLAFMGLWFLTMLWFPYNFASTVFLILIFYGLSKHSLSKEDNASINKYGKKIQGG
ncbi:MAG: glycosyltransferase family 87 protein [Promethearchaeota archaeon]